MTNPVEGTGVAARLARYELSRGVRPETQELSAVSEGLDGLIEKAAVLLAVMPPHQPRDTIEKLVAPNDPDRGRRAVDALLAASLAQVDARGHLQRVG